MILGTINILGLREIMDETKALKVEWERKQVQPVLEHLYHDIWVYGPNEMGNPVDSLGLSETITDKINHTGFRTPERVPYLSVKAKGIVLTIGFVISAANVSIMELMPLVDRDFGAVFRKSLDSPESLTLDEMARLSARNVMMLVGRENEFEQLQLGTLDKWGWKRSEAAVKYALNNRWHRHWWETVGRNIFRPDFVEWIDGVLKDPAIVMDKGYFENLRLK